MVSWSTQNHRNSLAGHVTCCHGMSVVTMWHEAMRPYVSHFLKTTTFCESYTIVSCDNRERRTTNQPTFKCRHKKTTEETNLTLNNPNVANTHTQPTRGNMAGTYHQRRWRYVWNTSAMPTCQLPTLLLPVASTPGWWESPLFQCSQLRPGDIG